MPEKTVVDRRNSRNRRTSERTTPDRRVVKRRLDAIPDVPDFRDHLYTATLVEVPASRPLENYLKAQVKILDQGTEGACTGYGLATVAHYLLRTRHSDITPRINTAGVSPHMLYSMAKRYDEWPGEKYDGSSARGAIKGWYKHGVCRDELWKSRAASLNAERAEDARLRPLGAYYRVNHKDIVSMHAALAEVGILYASASVHEGWNEVGSHGIIPYHSGSIGGHAFAIVAYDQNGFWIQNSWGSRWGKEGFGLVSYDDWLANGTDVWVVRLGVPVTLNTFAGTAATQRTGARASRAYSFAELRPHIISIGNDGQLRDTGTYGTGEQDVINIINEMQMTLRLWEHPRILLYAHGGLVSEDDAVQKVAELRSVLLENEIYPLSFIWKSDYWSTLKDILEDAANQRRPEGIWDRTRDFLLDRADDLLEPVARVATGKAEWSEMKENALAATKSQTGGARFTASLIARAVNKCGAELHMAGHSAGSIFHAPLVQYLATSGRIATGPLKGQTGLGIPIASCTLWAPACTMELFEQTYAPLAANGNIGNLGLFTLTDHAEQDDSCADIYHKSLLYLVSNAFEATARIPGIREGVPILGMERFILKSATIQALRQKNRLSWVTSPNTNDVGSPDAARSRSHGGFDDDEATLRATLARILNTTTAAFAQPAATDRRAALARTTWEQPARW